MCMRGFVFASFPYDGSMSIRHITIFTRPDNKEGIRWKKKLAAYLSAKHPEVQLKDDSPASAKAAAGNADCVIALGGDGTILEAARTFRKGRPLIVGLNLGHVGFLASVREPKDFLPAVDRLLADDYHPLERMVAMAAVERDGKTLRRSEFLNEAALQSLLGAIKLSVLVDGHPLQHIHGNGVLVATPTGSTAYNLSAHGPIVAPDISCFIVTEILDHHIPTPPVVLKRTKTIRIRIDELRQKGVLALAKTGEPIDAILTADGAEPFPLQEGDEVTIRRSSGKIRFAEFEKNYFLKSLQEKFAFR